VVGWGQRADSVISNLGQERALLYSVPAPVGEMICGSTAIVQVPIAKGEPTGRSGCGPRRS
jgi:hypothetical protein